MKGFDLLFLNYSSSEFFFERLPFAFSAFSIYCLFWTFIIAAGMGLACYAVILCVEDYLSNCSNKTDRKEFIRKMIVRYFLPLILIIIVAFVVCGMFGVNIFGGLIIIGMIYFVITFPRFVNRYLPRE